MRNFKQVLREFNLPPGIITDSGAGLHYLGLHLIGEHSFDRIIMIAEKWGEVWNNQGASRSIAHNYIDSHWLNSCSELGQFFLRLNCGEGKPQTPTEISSFRSVASWVSLTPD